jgi:hypothetical protein
VPVKAERRDVLDRAPPELRVSPSLRDPEDELAVRARRRELAPGPGARPLDGPLEVGARRVAGRTDVEAHGDVRPEPPLHVGRELRREPGQVAVVDRAERDAVLVRFRDRVPQREHLEAAGVREDRTVPAHEPVQAAELLDHVDGGPEEQVVRVPEDDRGTDRPQPVRVEPLDGRLRPDRHEGRRRHVAVGRAEDTGARGCVGGGQREGHPDSLTPEFSARGSLDWKPDR